MKITRIPNAKKKKKERKKARITLILIFLFVGSCRSPCLLFMDDLDLVCGSREKAGSTGVVTALLHLLDGVTGSAEGNYHTHSNEPN